MESVWLSARIRFFLRIGATSENRRGSWLRAASRSTSSQIVVMDNNLLEALLHEEESSSLDFKRQQYAFEGATDDEKSELLKDVLAFANAWRRNDAYILIGIDEVRGSEANL